MNVTRRSKSDVWRKLFEGEEKTQAFKHALYNTHKKT